MADKRSENVKVVHTNVMCDSRQDRRSIAS